jgi:hypothetical protein
VSEDLVASERKDLGDTPVENPVTGNRFEEDFQAVQDFTDSLARGVREGPVGTGAALLGERLFPDEDEAGAEFGRDLTRRSVTGTAASAVRLPSAPIDTVAGAKEFVETGAFVGTGDEAPRSERLNEAGEQAGRFLDDVATSARDRPVEFAAGAALETAVGGAITGGVRRGASSVPDAPGGGSAGVSSGVSRADSAFDLPNFRANERAMLQPDGGLRQRQGGDGSGGGDLDSVEISGTSPVPGRTPGQESGGALSPGGGRRGPQGRGVGQGNTPRGKQGATVSSAANPDFTGRGGRADRPRTVLERQRSRASEGLPRAQDAPDPLDPTARTPQGDVVEDSDTATRGGSVAGAVDLSVPGEGLLSETETVSGVDVGEGLQTGTLGDLGERGDTRQGQRADQRTDTAQRTDTLLDVGQPRSDPLRPDQRTDANADRPRAPRGLTEPDRPRRGDLDLQLGDGGRERNKESIFGAEQRFEYGLRDLL